MSTRKKTSHAQKPPGEPSGVDPTAAGQISSEITHPGEAQSVRAKMADREAAEMFSIFRRELGSSGFVTLRRSHPGSGQFKDGYIGTMPVDQFTIENVTSIYGGGDFIARGRTAGGNFNEERRFTIDHTIPPKNPQAPAKENKEPAAAPDIAAIVTAVAAAMPKPAAPQDNSGLVEIVKAALARPEPKGEMLAITEMIKEGREEARRAEERFMKLFERIGQPPPVKSLREQLEEAKELLDMLGDRGGGSSEKPESFWRELGKGAAEALVPLVKAHFGGAAPLTPGVPLIAAAPSSVTAAPPSNPPDASVAGVSPEPANPNEEVNAPLNFALKMFRTQAIAAARNGLDAYDWTDSIIASVPPPMLNAVFKAANDENWFANIFGSDPEAMKQTKFLNLVRESILAKAFAAHVENSAETKQTAEATATAFIDWVSADFDDALAGLAHPDSWKEFFARSAIAPAWLESLRLQVEKSLNSSETNVVELKPPDNAEKRTK